MWKKQILHIWKGDILSADAKTLVIYSINLGVAFVYKTFQCIAAAVFNGYWIHATGLTWSLTHHCPTLTPDDYKQNWNRLTLIIKHTFSRWKCLIVKYGQIATLWIGPSWDVQKFFSIKNNKTFRWQGVSEGKHLYCCTLSVSLQRPSS